MRFCIQNFICILSVFSGMYVKLYFSCRFVEITKRECYDAFDTVNEFSKQEMYSNFFCLKLTPTERLERDFIVAVIKIRL
jgi:hypothetical protein